METEEAHTVEVNVSLRREQSGRSVAMRVSLPPSSVPFVERLEDRVRRAVIRNLDFEYDVSYDGSPQIGVTVRKGDYFIGSFKVDRVFLDGKAALSAVDDFVGREIVIRIIEMRDRFGDLVVWRQQGSDFVFSDLFAQSGGESLSRKGETALKMAQMAATKLSGSLSFRRGEDLGTEVSRLRDTLGEDLAMGRDCGTLGEEVGADAEELL